MDHLRPQRAWHPEIKSIDEHEATKNSTSLGNKQLGFLEGIHYASFSMFHSSIQRGTSVQEN